MLKKIKLPDWLTPGSATPFEGGIAGILKAIKALVAVASPIIKQLAEGPFQALTMAGQLLSQMFTDTLKVAIKGTTDWQVA